MPSVAAVRWIFALLVAGLASAAAAQEPVPLYDSIGLNIGLNCQWKQKCMAEQQRAMKRALRYVKTQRPPSWRVQLCNHNAGRGRDRIDWAGFDNCVRNESLLPPVRHWARRRRQF